MKGLKRLAGGGLLLLEVRGLRREVAGLREALERVAMALELRNDHDFPVTLPATDEAPEIEITYADTPMQQELADIELRLTAARGRIPTEEEIQEEFERRHAQD